MLPVGEATDIPKSIHCIEDFHLTRVANQEILLDIYYREKRPVSERAALIFIHGGGFWGGDKKQFLTHAAYLALQYNVFTISLNYRLSGDAVFPAALQDVKCAIRWVRSVGDHYNIDPDKIILVGGSPGGNLAAMAATTPEISKYEGSGGYHGHSSQVNLAVILNGIFDFFDFLKNAPEERENIRRYLGGYIEDIPEIYAEASPLQRVNRRTAPMLLLHGLDDQVIPWQSALRMHEKLKATGIASEIKIFEGKNHGWFNETSNLIPTMEPIIKFLQRYQYL